MWKAVIICLSLIFALVFCPEAMAQSKKEKDEAPKKSTATSYRATVPIKESKVLKTIYQYNTRQYLPGNRCLEEYTQKLGFQYVVLPPNQKGSKTDAGLRLHNLATKFIVLFKNGPFWHHRLNQRIKECRSKSGDFTG